MKKDFSHIKVGMAGELVRMSKYHPDKFKRVLTQIEILEQRDYHTEEELDKAYHEVLKEIAT